MSVSHGSLQESVAEHNLYHPHIAPFLHKIGGESVTECMCSQWPLPCHLLAVPCEHILECPDVAGLPITLLRVGHEDIL